MKGYAVLDTETTGFNKFSNDRMIEIGIVLLSPDLQVEGTYETVLNPHRDLGPTHVHHLSGAICEKAPNFRDIDAALLTLLNDRVIVAHNAPFDTKFLTIEFLANGKDLDFSNNCIDTVTMLKHSVKYQGHSNKLETACEFYGIKNLAAHTALSDAIATAELFIRLASESSAEKREITKAHPFNKRHLHKSVSFHNWKGRDEISETLSKEANLKPFISNLHVSNLLDHDAILPTVADSYLSQMHGQLVNGSYLTAQSKFIENLIKKNQLSQRQTMTLHEEYFSMRVCRFYATSNYILTPDHEHRLKALSAYLQITPANAKRITQQTVQDSHLIIPKAQKLETYFSLDMGDTVVLTGEEWAVSKSELTTAFIANGIIPVPSVSGKVKAIICNDPHSLSRKAVRARELGVPTLSEKTITELTGIILQPR